MSNIELAVPASILALLVGAAFGVWLGRVSVRWARLQDEDLAYQALVADDLGTLAYLYGQARDRAMNQKLMQAIDSRMGEVINTTLGKTVEQKPALEGRKGAE